MKRKKRTKKRSGTTRTRRRVSSDTKFDLLKSAKLLGAGAAGLLIANKASNLLGTKFGSMAPYAKIAIPAGMAVGIPILMRKMGMRDNVLSYAMIAGSGITAAAGLADMLKMGDVKKHLGLAGEDEEIVEIDLNDPAQLAAFQDAVGDTEPAESVVSGDYYLPDANDETNTDYNPAMGFQPGIVV